MNTNNIQKENGQTQCCIDFCQTIYHIDDQEVVNKYKCNQAAFSAYDMWRIRRSARQFSIKTNL
ncbi:hypothetical protein SY85_10555 [Flavisolibacter tropicus]|uniref:Uncharacterized protein n=1 Tax=Flavisolibacter tropicus TaxID=1492898 RepID=A0A172TV79_9BACT|nr:hypothetical protein SY85_10555 [Flavisolibacter tropicus]